jgi:hypothetical protein
VKGVEPRALLAQPEKDAGARRLGCADRVRNVLAGLSRLPHVEAVQAAASQVMEIRIAGWVCAF